MSHLLWHTTHTIQRGKQVNYIIGAKQNKAIYISRLRRVKLNPNNPPHQAVRMSRAMITAKRSKIEKTIDKQNEANAAWPCRTLFTKGYF